MDLRHLRYLRLCVELGSFSAAAHAAGVTQPAVSHGIKVLEREFGEPLFTVSGRRRVPTAAARRLASAAAAVHEQLRRSAPPAPRRPRCLRAGLVASATLLYGEAIRQAWCDRPGRTLEIVQADEGTLLRQLQRAELDLVVGPMPRGEPPAGLARHWLFMSAPRVYGRRGHPLAHGGSLEALQAAQWVVVGPAVSGPVDVLREAFRVRRLAAPRVVVSGPDYASALRLATTSDLLCVVPHEAIVQDLRLASLVPFRLREALPRYDEFLFTAAHPRGGLVQVVERIKSVTPVPADDRPADTIAR